jgi:hypothetical protein
MAEPRRTDKMLKKDQQGPRDVRTEVTEEIASGPTSPIVRQPNRDRARGDWDRTGDHHDEGQSRADDERIKRERP